MIEKVTTGQRVSFKAADFNSMADAANYINLNKPKIGAVNAGSRGSNPNVFFIENNSGADLDRGYVLGIDTPITTPDADEDRFCEGIAFEGVEPVAGTHEGKFAVLVEPINDGDLGRAAVAGIVQAKVDIQAETDKFADIEGASTLLKSGASGAKILWKETGTGEKWAVVRLGLPTNLPPIYKATSAQDGTTVEAKKVQADGSLDSGDAEELAVYSDAYPARENDLLLLTSDAAGKPAAMPIHGNLDPFVLSAGTDDTANTDEWDITDQPESYAGVHVEKWFRLYWSGNSGDPVYQFTREAKYDSRGALVYVGPEVRTNAFSTNTCEE
jgi:hypothetical protein